MSPQLGFYGVVQCFFGFGVHSTQNLRSILSSFETITDWFDLFKVTQAPNGSFPGFRRARFPNQLFRVELKRWKFNTIRGEGDSDLNVTTYPQIKRTRAIEIQYRIIRRNKKKVYNHKFDTIRQIRPVPVSTQNTSKYLAAMRPAKIRCAMMFNIRVKYSIQLNTLKFWNLCGENTTRCRTRFSYGAESHSERGLWKSDTKYL